MDEALQSLLIFIVILVAYFGPLFLVPMTFKWAGSALGMAANGLKKFSGQLNKPAQGWMDKQRGRTQWSMGRAQKKAAEDRAAKANFSRATQDRAAGKGRFGAAGAWAQGRRGVGYGKHQERVLDLSSGEYEHQQEEDAQNRVTRQTADMHGNREKEELQKILETGDVRSASVAAGKLATSGGGEYLRKGMEKIKTTPGREGDYIHIQDKNFPAVKAVAPEIIQKQSTTGALSPLYQPHQISVPDLVTADTQLFETGGAHKNGYASARVAGNEAALRGFATQINGLATADGQKGLGPKGVESLRAYDTQVQKVFDSGGTMHLQYDTSSKTLVATQIPPQQVKVV